MAIFFLLLTFPAILLSVFIFSEAHNGLKSTIIKAGLLFSAVVLILTEVTGYFQILNFKSILTGWILILIFNCIYLFINRNQLLSKAASVTRFFTHSFASASL